MQLSDRWRYGGIRSAGAINVARARDRGPCGRGAERSDAANADESGDSLLAGRHGSRDSRRDGSGLSFRVRWHAESRLHALSRHDARVGSCHRRFGRGSAPRRDQHRSHAVSQLSVHVTFDRREELCSATSLAELVSSRSRRLVDTGRRMPDVGAPNLGPRLLPCARRYRNAAPCQPVGRADHRLGAPTGSCDRQRDEALCRSTLDSCGRADRGCAIRHRDCRW